MNNDEARMKALTKLYKNYTKNIQRGEGGTLLTNNANTKMLSDINNYISRYIENEDLTDAQKRQMYKELKQTIKTNADTLYYLFKINSMDPNPLSSELNTQLAPVLEQISNRRKELKPPPEALPIVEAVRAEPLGIIDRFKSMFGRPEILQEPTSAIARAQTPIATATNAATPFMSSDENIASSILPVATIPTMSRPSNRSPRINSFIQQGGGGGPSSETNTEISDISFV